MKKAITGKKSAGSIDKLPGDLLIERELLVRDPVLAEIVSRIIAAYHPLRIYLFGSKAQGKDGPDSDYDLLTMVPDDAPQEKRRARLAYQVLRGTGVAADVLVWTEGAFWRRARVTASLPATVLREGKLIYVN